MKKVSASLLAVVLAAGCGGLPKSYLNTDVAEPAGFQLKAAREIQQAGNMLISGTLEYESSGDLQRTFFRYFEDMKAHGWMPAQQDVGAEKGVGQLRKDTRVAAVEFTNAGGTIKAMIKVGPGNR